MKKTKYVMRFKTLMPFQKLEGLLAQYCHYPFDIKFDGMEESPRGSVKYVRVSFDDKSDADHVLHLIEKSHKEQHAPQMAKHGIGHFFGH